MFRSRVSAGYWQPFSLSTGFFSGRIQVQGFASSFDRRSSGQGCLLSTPRAQSSPCSTTAFLHRAFEKEQAGKAFVTEETCNGATGIGSRRNIFYFIATKEGASVWFYLFLGTDHTPHWSRLLGMQLFSYDTDTHTSSMLLRSSTYYTCCGTLARERRGKRHGSP